MNKNLLKVGSAISSAAIVMASFLGPAMAVSIEVTGNGSNSDNTVNYTQTNDVNIDQDNDADISNNIEVDAQTGNNDAEDNTGGDVSIETGDAEANVTVTNSANSNYAQVDNCCAGDVEVVMSGNGTKSNNDAIVKIGNKVDVDQDNDADFENDVDVWVDTGHNDAEDNTGGDVSIDTGDADATVTVSNAANVNGVVVGGDEDGGELSVVISGNGSNSENTVNLDLASKTKIDQDNDADIENDIEVDAQTGNNDAEDNTGGEVTIETGDASSDVNVENAANVNWADVDSCGCIIDGSVKVSGNGTDSDNDVKLDLSSKLDVDQDNDFDCGGGNHERKGGDCNDIEVESNTGDNDAEDNTTFDGDPSIETGDASSEVDVSNQANVNKVGDVDLGGDSINIDINLDGLLALLLGLLD